MPGTQCKICLSKHRAFVEEQCLKGVSARAVSEMLLNEYDTRVSHNTISRHMAKHLGKQAPESVSPALTPMEAMEQRLLNLEIFVANRVSNDAVTQWDEVDETGKKWLSLTETDLFHEYAGSKEHIEDARRDMVSKYRHKVMTARGSYKKTEENRTKRMLDAIHAREDKERKEETDAEQRALDEQNAAKALADKQVAERLAYIESHPSTP